MLRSSSGEWVENPENIAQMILEYFQSLYQVSASDAPDISQQGEEIDLLLRELNLPCISNEDLQLLTKPISDQEIRVAMFDLASNKSPGIDGIPADFYKLH